MSSDILDQPLMDPVHKTNYLSPYITAISNFSVQYNFQAISVVLTVMSTTVCTSSESDCKNGDQSAWVHGTATAGVFIGAIIGQLVMGYAGDVLGRTKAMTLTLMIATFSAALSAIAPQGDANSIYAVIIVCRVFLGIGLGGVYPLSAAKAAEDGAQRKGQSGKEQQKEVNTTKAAFAFFWQTPGSMAPWLVAYLLTFNSSMSADVKWRLLLGLGAIPAGFVVGLSVLESHLHPPESNVPAHILNSSVDNALHAPEYEASLSRSQKISEHESVKEDQELNVWELLQSREVQMKLAATGGGWFIYDVAYYGVALFAGTILNALSDRDDDNVSNADSMRHNTSMNLIALSVGIPAQVLFIYLLSVKGTKWIQVWGFVLNALSFFLLASLYSYLLHRNANILFALYCFLMFNLCGGTNISTFVLPAETYDKRIRATFNGISAAMGKFGAAVGCYLFGALEPVTTFPVIMIICGALCILGAILSQLFIPNKDRAMHVTLSTVDIDENPRQRPFV